ncbi:MAG: hypothetical protein EOP48_31745, partial [Sphingobacteriales bacterium]
MSKSASHAVASQNNQTANKDYPIGIFNSVLTGNEPFLADHIIQGKKILPGMAYLEITRAAVANSVTLGDKYMIVLVDSIFVSALTITEKRAIEVKIYPGANGEFGVEVSTDQGIHFQSKAYIRTKQEHTESTGLPTRLDIQQLKQQCPVAGPTKQEFYSTFVKRGVNLGPSHRGVEDIKIGTNCGLVKVSIPGSSKQGMGMDPGMLDSLIQGGVALSNNPEANVVPFAVKRTSVYGPLTDHMYVYMVQTSEGLDYTMADEAGDVRVIITGFLTREIDLNAQQDQLVFYKPEFQEDIAELDNNDSDSTTTIIKNQGSYNDLVKAVFETAQQLISKKVEQHTIEVQLSSSTPSFQGII